MQPNTILDRSQQFWTLQHQVKSFFVCMLACCFLILKNKNFMYRLHRFNASLTLNFKHIFGPELADMLRVQAEALLGILTAQR